MGLKFSVQSPSYGICAENPSPHGCLMPSPGPDDLQDRPTALSAQIRSWGGTSRHLCRELVGFPIRGQSRPLCAYGATSPLYPKHRATGLRPARGKRLDRWVTICRLLASRKSVGSPLPGPTFSAISMWHPGRRRECRATPSRRRGHAVTTTTGDMPPQLRMYVLLLACWPSRASTRRA